MDLFDFCNVQTIDESGNVSQVYSLRSLPENIDDIMPHILLETRKLPVKLGKTICSFFESCGNSVSAIYDKITSSDFSVMEIKGVCKDNVQEVYDFLSKTISIIKEFRDTSSEGESSHVITLPDDIENLMPVIVNKIDSLSSVRAKNAIQNFIEEQGNSVKRLYQSIISPKFSAKQMKYVGQTTIPEVEHFVAWVIDIVTRCSNPVLLKSQIDDFYRPNLKELLIPDKYHEKLWALEKKLGYFPVFAAISCYFDGLDEKTSTLVKNGTSIYAGHEIENLSEIAERFGRTRERIRQIRLQLINQLTSYFVSIRNYGFISSNPYKLNITQAEEKINMAEGTSFTKKFVRWVLCSTFDEFTLIGDLFKAMTHLFKNQQFVFAVDTKQNEIFDFRSFVNAVDSSLMIKRKDDECVELKSFLKPFYKNELNEAHAEEIEISCSLILSEDYNLKIIDNRFIVFPSNSRKNYPEIIEDILRKNGHPMTLNEICEEFSLIFPEKTVDPSAVRGNILTNHNIVPIGRSSTYSLDCWKNDENRGGTIRLFASECLDLNPNHIVPVEEICEYVRKFRPTSSNSSIVSNLIQERNNLYALYYCNDGKKYIGYRHNEYDSSYTISTLNQPVKRSLDESMNLLLEFVKENNCFPRNSKQDPEQSRLYRFMSRMLYLDSTGKMDEKLYLKWSSLQNSLDEIIKNNK